MTIEQIKSANAAAGFHFFEPDTLRFFRSRIGSKVYGGRFFVTSEEGPSGGRRYTVREALPDGRIQTIEPFYALTYGQAHAAARRCVRACA